MEWTDVNTYATIVWVWMCSPFIRSLSIFCSCRTVFFRVACIIYISNNVLSSSFAVSGSRFDIFFFESKAALSWTKHKMSLSGSPLKKKNYGCQNNTTGLNQNNINEIRRDCACVKKIQQKRKRKSERNDANNNYQRSAIQLWFCHANSQIYFPFLQRISYFVSMILKFRFFPHYNFCLRIFFFLCQIVENKRNNILLLFNHSNLNGYIFPYLWKCFYISSFLIAMKGEWERERQREKKEEKNQTYRGPLW